MRNFEYRYKPDLMSFKFDYTIIILNTKLGNPFIYSRDQFEPSSQ